MKKFVALLIILAMTSMSYGAYIQITHNGEIWEGEDFAPSDILDLHLVDETNAQAQSLAALSYISATNGDEGVFAWGTGLSPMMPTVTWDYSEGAKVTFNAMMLGQDMPTDLIVLSVDIHIPDYKLASDEITISWDIGYGADKVVGSELIHVIPEPATLALLGLGGLFLRRRRK